MAALDYRLLVGFVDHRKTKRLRRVCGDAGFVCLIRLFEYIRAYKPSGLLSGMSGQDIEDEADWAGTPGLFVKTLLDVAFLEGTDEGYVFHDWEDHNPYAAKSEDRSEQAKNAAKKRWGHKRRDAESPNQQCSGHESAMLKGENSNAPLPLPLPLPEEEPPLPPLAGGEGEGRDSPEEDPEEEFQAFRQAYPKEGGETAVRKAYFRIRQKGVRADVLLKAIGLHKGRDPTWQKNFPQFVPDPAKWLRDGLWQRAFPEPAQCGQGQNAARFEPKPDLSPEEKAESSRLIAEFMEKKGWKADENKNLLPVPS
jgi:hypothetical protein